jgi:hypothetical protein
MSADDRSHSSENSNVESSLPIGDLDQTGVEATAADQIKGGDTAAPKVHLTEIQVTKHTDVSSAG